MKKAFLLSVLLVLVVSLSFGQAQNYGYWGPFPDTVSTFDYRDVQTRINCGIGVDPEGKVWLQTYLGDSKIDSIDTGGGVYDIVRPIYVFNPDGSQASFSPIYTLTGVDEFNSPVTDTLFGRSGYGGSINPANGNFLAVWSGGLLWEINYKTGAGVRKTMPAAGILDNSPASVAANAAGEIFLARVLSGGPGQILNPDFTAGTQFAADVPDIGRTIAVSADGNNVYVPRFTGAMQTVIYNSANGSLGPYTFADSILQGWSVETIAFHPTTGYLWVAADRRSDSVYHTMYTDNSFYALDVANNYAVVDSFSTAMAFDPATTYPRGMAFSPTGDTVYVGHFDGGEPAVHRFIAGYSTSVQRVDDAVPSGFALEQNFPNPFNPTTEIRFAVGKAGFTTVRVYDMLGREVAQLVNQELEAGSFTATFDAASLPSGTYVYEIVSGGVRLTKKMMLLK
jgi:hypothetical protein